MSFKDKLFARLDTVEDAFIEGDDVAAVLHAEDWVPPHKMAGLVPYDVVLTFDEKPESKSIDEELTGVPCTPFGSSGTINEEDVEELLESAGIEYDRVITVDENDDPRYPGEAAAFISLAEYGP